jgi:predicted nucleic acid-binding protein
VTGFLLDTNIPSALTQVRPEVRVRDWVNAQANFSLYFSVVSIGEMRRGFTTLPLGKRRRRLEEWFDSFLIPLSGERILPVTHRIGDRWGVLDGECRMRGMNLNTADGLIAATALEHGLTVATRNVKDFTGLGVPILNPWDG